MNTEDIIDQLNSFLRGEISAVETYAMARERVSALGPQGDLARCQSSHEGRVVRLTAKIAELGGEPATSSGVWGAFAKLTESGAALFGEAAAVGAIEEGEDHGRDDYKRGLEKYAVGADGFGIRGFIEDLLAEQLQTHAIMASLKKIARDHRAPHVNP